VDGLNDRINSVNRKADARQRENDDLTGEVGRLNRFVAEAEPFVVNDRLKNVPVVVVATRGADADRVKSQVAMLQQAGAVAPGIVWLEDSWALKGGDVEKLASALGESSRDPSVLREAAWRALAARLEAGRTSPGSVVPSGAAAPPYSDGLTALTGAGFVTFEGIGDQGSKVDLATFPGRAARALLVTGTSTGPSDHAVVVRGGARALTAAGMPTVAGEVFANTEGAQRGATLRALRADDALAGVSTVDDLELPEGWIAVVLAEADLGRQPPVAGHYGYGDGAQRALPQWQS
jgi:hypothetical protein